MNAVIDIGNTKAKVGLFKGNDSLITSVIKPSELSGFIQSHQIKKILISNVAHTKLERPIEWNNLDVNYLTVNTPMPITTSYATPTTLGVDRLAACVGARNYTKKNVLIIDAGSCITYDILTANDEHLGGLISPGLNMRLKAMHTFTANLPLVPFNNGALIGDSTQKCLQSGAASGTLAEMKGLIQRFQGEFKNLSIIIGGGDAVFFDKNLELNTFVVPNLAIEGLHTIFKYNEKA